MTAQDPFSKSQKAHFDLVEGDRFRWQTENPVISALERELLGGVGRLKGTVLEVGCGEGANLHTAAGGGKSLIGLDYSRNRVAFAKGKTARPVICGDALALPVRNGSCDAVFCRDVIHHIPLKRQGDFIAQMRDALKDGGTLIVIEANGLNPNNFGFSLVKGAERNLRLSTASRVRSLLESEGLQIVEAMTKESLQYRLILHYGYGMPSLASSRAAKALMRAAQAATDLLWPRFLYMYNVFVCVKRP
jgi:SAM-dependent methyltransferase